MADWIPKGAAEREREEEGRGRECGVRGEGGSAVEWVVDFVGCRDARWVRCGISTVFVGHFLLLLSISCVEHEI